MKSNLAAALVAFDSKELQDLFDEILITCDLTFGYLNGLRVVTLKDRRDKLEIVAYRKTLVEAMSFIVEVWQSIQAVEIVPDDIQSQKTILAELEAA